MRLLTGDRIVKLTILGIGIVLLVIAFLRRNHPLPPNVCPLDGRMAEWTKPRNGSICEHGHFSYIEKTNHTWLGPCK